MSSSSLSSLSLLLSPKSKALKAMEGIYRECGVELVNLINKRYNMDINLEELLSNEKEVSKVSNVLEKDVSVVSFPIPFNKNKVNRELCQGLCYNHGLFTQCQKKQTDEKGLCKGCSKEAEKSKTGSPNCGTIEARLATDLMEYTDGKGRKPIAYVKVLEKLSISIETVKEMASKENIEIDSIHFEMAEAKRGRPKTKITKKVEATTVEDLFATLVNEELNDVDSIVETVVMSASDEEKDETELVADKEAKLAEKEAKLAADKEAKLKEKEAKLAADKEAKLAEKEAKLKEKEAKLAAEKEAKELKLKEKEAKLAAEKEAKEAKLAAEKEAKLKEKEAKLAEKEAKLAADKAAKEEKEAKLAAEKEAKKAPKEKVQKEKVVKKKEETVAAVVADKEAPKEKKEEENPTKVSVKRITIDGKEYFKTSANILYDPETKEEVGLYDAETNSIKELPDDSDNELQEDEYDSDN
jgi:hypothetical protein